VTITPVRFTANTRSQRSGVPSSSGSISDTPAFATQTSSSPAAATALAMSDGSLTSPVKPS
jgi:hypothetical protein